MLKSIFVGILPALLYMPRAVPAPAPATPQAAKATAEPSDQERARAAYAKGQKALARDTEAGMKEAVKHFQEAARVDPNYAPAQVALAETYTMLWGFGILWRPEALARAKAAARKAVELDPKLAAARTALGAVKMNESGLAGAEGISGKRSRSVPTMSLPTNGMQFFWRLWEGTWMRSDNGGEFTSRAVRNWLNRVGVKTLFIEPGSPW